MSQTDDTNSDKTTKPQPDEKLKSSNTVEKRMTPEQVDTIIPVLLGLKTFFESKDKPLSLTQLLEGVNMNTGRIQDLTTRIGGLENTVRNFLEYVKAEQINTGGQAKITQQPTQQQTASRGDATPSQADLDAIPWQFNKRGEWTYSRNRDGSDSDNPVIQSLVYMLTNKSPLTLYGMEYSLSGQNGMFIGRVAAGSASRQQSGSGYSGGRRNY